MTWVRLDDQFNIHRKLARLSDAAFRLHVSALCWSARNLMDGFVPEADLDDVCARVRTPARFAAECVERDVWHPAGYVCDSEACPACPDSKWPVAAGETGWIIHDYFEYQYSKEQVQRDRQANKERQKRHRDTRNDPRNAVSNAVSNGSSNSTPSRPDPKNGSVGSGTERSSPVLARKPFESSTTNSNGNGAAARHPSARPLLQALAESMPDRPPPRRKGNAT